MTYEKLFENGIERTSDAERLAGELEERQNAPIRVILAEDVYAGMQGIASDSKTVYVDGDVGEDALQYLDDRGFNVEEYEDFFDETEVLVGNGITVESPTEEAFMKRLQEKIDDENGYSL